MNVAMNALAYLPRVSEVFIASASDIQDYSNIFLISKAIKV